MQLESFLTGPDAIPKSDPTAPRLAQPNAIETSGLFSTLSSYLLAPYGSAGEGQLEEVDQADVDASLQARDSLCSSKIEELYEKMRSPDNPALQTVAQAALALCETCTSHVMQLDESMGEAYGNRDRSDWQQRTYDRRNLYNLEMCTGLARRCSPQSDIRFVFRSRPFHYLRSIQKSCHKSSCNNHQAPRLISSCSYTTCLPEPLGFSSQRGLP